MAKAKQPSRRYNKKKLLIIIALTLIIALSLGWLWIYVKAQYNSVSVQEVIAGLWRGELGTTVASKKYTMRHSVYNQSAITAKKYSKVSLASLANSGGRTINTGDACRKEWNKQKKAKFDYRYFCWDTPDRTKAWLSQGITGSGSARSSLDGGNKSLLLVSWYTTGNPNDIASGSDDANRLTVVNLRTKKYRHIELTKPCDTGTKMCRLGSHSGGLAWAGNYLYVASSVGMYMYDLGDIKMVNGTPVLVAKEAYVLNYSTKGGEWTARMGTVSFDSTKNQLVTGEFRAHGDTFPPQVMRWSLNGQHQLGHGGTISTASSFTSNVRHMQGVASYKGKYVFFSSSTKVAGRSGNGGAMITWKPGQNAKYYIMPWHQESAYIDESNKRVWGLTESGPHEATAFVFSLPGGAVL